jgi:hypothetical protein
MPSTSASGKRSNFYRLSERNIFSGSVNIFYGSESADPKFDSESGSGRPINYGFGRIWILSCHYCDH